MNAGMWWIGCSLIAAGILIALAVAARKLTDRHRDTVPPQKGHDHGR